MSEAEKSLKQYWIEMDAAVLNAAKAVPRRLVNETVETGFIGVPSDLKYGVDVPVPDLICIPCHPLSEDKMAKPTMEEMMPDPETPNPTGEELWNSPNYQELWASARGELIGFANHLIRTDRGITGQQILMAVAGGDYKLFKMTDDRE